MRYKRRSTCRQYDPVQTLTPSHTLQRLVYNGFQTPSCGLDLSLLAKGSCDIAVSDSPARYTDGVPSDEKITLASIVEDHPEDIMTVAKDW
jgi:hypothetical protein